ncbi:MAG: HAD hydrolase-like protein [Nanoarchaeota archaeon]
MEKRIVTIDFDDVIVDTQKYQCDLAEKMFGVKLNIANSRQSQHVPEYLTQNQYDELIHTLYETSEGANIPLVVGAKEYLNKLQENGYLPKVVTARSDEETKYAREILEKEKIGIEIFNSNYTPKKDLCSGSFAHIDDAPHHLNSLEGIVKNLILLNKPHNKQIKVKDEIRRINSWKEFYSFLRNNE